MKGRNRAFDRAFPAYRTDPYEKLPLVILIDQGTASASEIVSGAVMDHDRGLVVGEDSWGKGLVQTVFSLDGNLAVALTTAKYFTPSGRSIQRDYGHIEDYMLYKQAPEEQREVKYTAKGRKVLGQGGISPDFKVASTLKSFTLELMNKGTFFGYARKFAARQTALSRSYVFPNGTGKSEGAGLTPLDKSFVVDDRVLADFRSYLTANGIAIDESRLKEAESEVKRELERAIFSSVWGIEEGVRVYQRSDSAVLKALEVMPEAAKFVSGSESP
jgi:carboxyl-terminal processing protease